MKTMESVYIRIIAPTASEGWSRTQFMNRLNYLVTSLKSKMHTKTIIKNIERQRIYGKFSSKELLEFSFSMLSVDLMDSSAFSNNYSVSRSYKFVCLSDKWTLE